LGYSEQQHYVLCKLKELRDELNYIPKKVDFKRKFPRINIDVLFGSFNNALAAAGLLNQEIDPKIEKREPRILTFDIETKPLKVYTFGLFDQNIGLNQIIEDWSVMAWAAKWKHKDDIIYQDLSSHTDYTNDEILIYGIWELLNECDVVITQNGMRFDVPKLNAKFTKYKLGPPKPYRHIDTYRIKKKLGLTSKKLAYSTEYFNERIKKLEHSKFPGFSLWSECLKGNMEAWKEMKEYNIHDVLALEELYFDTLIQWDDTINFGVYSGVPNCCPNCGNTELEEKDYVFTKTGMFASFQCQKCKRFCSSKENLLLKSARKSLLK
jgi:uncharacterized protein YprB with RNaseH-like and TPR domain